MPWTTAAVAALWGSCSSSAKGAAEGCLVGGSAGPDQGVGADDEGSDEGALPGGEAGAELAGVGAVVAEVGGFVAAHGGEQNPGKVGFVQLDRDGGHARVCGHGQPFVDGADGVVGQ